MIDTQTREKYTAVIGLEVHAQMLTKSKAYSSDSTEYGSMPNTNLSAITMGLPGTLPKVNKSVVDNAIKMGLATDCKIREYNTYARKNYFYPDLPKGYQITQDKTPICTEGKITIDLEDGTEKHIGITRIHMEEDAGKSMHLDGEIDTLVDFNRAGVALIEIVSEPEIRTSDEAYKYLQEVRKLVRYLEICDGNMEEGSLRCDANISVMLNGSKTFGTKVEVKNMNSFRNVKSAIEYEIERQIHDIEKGITIVSETRQFDAVTCTTKSLRTKEALNDYRYFPEPDLPLLRVSQNWITDVKNTLPPLPRELKVKFQKDYGLSAYDANVLIDSKEIALYFEELCTFTKNYKSAANWVTVTIKSYLNELTLHIAQFPLVPKQIAEIIDLIDQNLVSNSSATQKIFPELIQNPNKTAKEIAQSLNLIQESNAEELQQIVDKVVAQFPDKVNEYKSGKKGLLGMFMGQIMKETGGKADPKITNQLLINTLEK